MFTFDPLEVGNPMTLGMTQEELESEIDRMIADCNQGKVFSMRDVLSLLNRYGAQYSALPQYLQKKIDMINIL